ncbi:GD22539 [Drosophila simulans]|uniref:GD22539 n=1 Tax=Drosophila simulans TaxID=7240 RepID=B4Q522_DROSI|nr:GD22539 [Drosophila simulans]
MEQKHIVIIFGILMALLLIIDIILIVYIVLDVRFAYEVYYHARRPILRMNQQLVLILIGVSVILCLVALNLLFIYFIIDNPYMTTLSRRTLATTAPTWDLLPEFEESIPSSLAPGEEASPARR